MLSLYTVQFSIVPEEGREADTPRVIKEMVRRWIGGNRRMEAANIPVAPGEYSFPDDQSIEITEETSDDRNAFLWSLTWRHPDDHDWQVMRAATCQLAGYEGVLEFSVRQYAEPRAEDFVLSPADTKLRFGRPPVVPLMIRRFDCYNHHRRLTATPTILNVEDIRDFVEGTLFSSDRHLPAVVFSVDPRSGGPVGAPEIVAENLAGLAEVYTLADIPTSYELTAQLGKLLSCYNGAVRIYYPGFSLRSNYEECPLYLADSLLFLQHEYSFARKLLRLISSVAVMRYAPGPIYRKAEAELVNQRRIMPVIAGLDAISLDDAQVERIVQDQVGQYREEVRRLHSRIHALESALDSVRGQLAEIIGDYEEEDEVEESRFADVTDAVMQAEEDFNDILIFHPKAHTSAERSPYGQPERAYRALQALAEVGRIRRAAVERGESIGALEDAFKERGFTYTARISMTSRGQYGHEYEITYENEKHAIHEHLVLGKGTPKTCLRIHFFWDDYKQAFVIGHVGRHKTNTRS